MRFAAVVVLAFATFGAGAQDQGYDPRHSFGGFVEYANDSSHILIGQSWNRKLVGAGGSYSLRLTENRTLAWRWQIDVRPLVLLRDPVSTVTITNTVVGMPTVIPFLPGTSTTTLLQSRECQSSSGHGVYTEGLSPVVVGTYTYTSVCGNRWTYGGAVSPLGQRLNFRPHARWQPYVAGNAGFVAFSEIVPSNNATKFNFSFEFAAGVEFFTRGGRRPRSLSADVRYHHISNADRGVENPGVDTVLGRVSYSFGR